MRKLPPGKRIETYLQKKRLSQRAFAPLVLMSEARLSLVIAGKALPTIHQLAEIEALVGLTARDFAESAA